MLISNNILLVEDDPDDQLLFTTALKAIDPSLKCTIANNGLEAIEHLKKAQDLPDIVFLDLEMPVMNGFSFLRGIKLYNNLKPLPIVVLTSLDDYIVAERTKVLGASAFLTKSSDRKSLQCKIHHLLNFDFSINSGALRPLFFTEIS